MQFQVESIFSQRFQIKLISSLGFSHSTGLCSQPIITFQTYSFLYLKILLSWGWVRFCLLVCFDKLRGQSEHLTISCNSRQSSNTINHVSTDRRGTRAINGRAKSGSSSLVSSAPLQRPEHNTGRRGMRETPRFHAQRLCFHYPI